MELLSGMITETSLSFSKNNTSVYFSYVRNSRDQRGSPSLLDAAIYGAHDSPPSRRIATASWYAAVYASRASGLWSGALALMAGR